MKHNLNNLTYLLGILGVIVFFVAALIYFSVAMSKILHTPHTAETTITEENIDTIYVEKALSDFQLLQMAIILTESEFNPSAIGENKDYGIMQITPIYVDEVNRILGENKFSHQDAFDTTKALQMFNIMQNHHNPEHNMEKAIKLHNKAPWYEKRVKANLEKIKNYEHIRSNI